MKKDFSYGTVDGVAHVLREREKGVLASLCGRQFTRQIPAAVEFGDDPCPKCMKKLGAMERLWKRIEKEQEEA